MTTTCKNCNHQFDGKYCNSCGQPAATRDIDFNSILHEIQHTILHFDKGILYTTKQLLTRPGHSIREYIEGKRVNHFKPIAYLLLLSTAYVLLTQLSHKSTFLDQFLSGVTAGANKSETERSDFLIDVITWMKNNYAYATLLILPIISLSSYLSFYKTKYNYFQHVVLNAYVAGLRTAVFLLILPITYFISDNGWNDIVDTFKFFLGIGLTFWSYFQFFHAVKPAKRLMLTVLTYVLMAICFAFLLILLAIIAKTFHY